MASTSFGNMTPWNNAAHRSTLRSMGLMQGVGISAKAFGAKGDNVQDDGPALTQAISTVFNDPSLAFLVIPPGRYRVATPIAVTYDHDVSYNHGIMAYGADLVSGLAGGGSHVLSLGLSGGYSVQACRIHGLKISGNGSEGNGLDVSVLANDRWFYNFTFTDMLIRFCGNDGMHLEGSIFEASCQNSFFRQNGNNGVSAGTGPSSNGIFSAFDFKECVFGQNENHGLELIGGAYDARVSGGYTLLNGVAGIYAPNGITLIERFGTENNYLNAGAFNVGTPQAGLVIDNFGTFKVVSGHCGDSYFQNRLLRMFAVGNLSLEHCNMTGGPGGTGSKLATITGAGADMMVRMSGGEIEVTPKDHDWWAVDDRLTAYDVADLPDPVYNARRMLWVNNDTYSGATLAISDGTFWRTADGNVIT